MKKANAAEDLVQAPRRKAIFWGAKKTGDGMGKEEGGGRSQDD